MPPKKADPKKAVETVIAPVEGVKFISVICGPKDSDITLLANINCRVDILVDYIRAEILRIILVKTTDLRNAGAVGPPPPPTSPGKQSTKANALSATSAAPPTSSSPTPLDDKLVKLLALNSVISALTVSTIDLNEEGAPNLNLREVQ